MTEFAGIFHDGRTTASVPVRVIVGATDIAIDDGSTVPRVVARRDVAVDAPVPGVVRTLRLPDGEAIETHEQAAIAQLWPSPSAVARIALALESRWTTAIASLAATGALAWIVIAFALPLAAEPVAQLVSPRVDKLMGKQVLASLDKTFMRPSQLDDARKQEVQEKFDRYVEREPGDYRLELRRGGSPNALALPGGIILVTDEMIEAVDSDDELYAVIAHEIGHERGRHALRLVLQDSGVAVLMTALAGDAVSVTLLAAAMPTLLVQTSYSRRFETEADDYAFASLKRHGVSPRAFADLMRRMREHHGAKGDDTLARYLSTHPMTEERIQRAEQAR